MISWLTEQTIICSFLIVCLLGMSRWLNKNIGAFNTYLLWSVVPISFLLPIGLEYFKAASTVQVFSFTYEDTLLSLKQSTDLNISKIAMWIWLSGAFITVTLAIFWHFKSITELELQPSPPLKSCANKHNKLLCFNSDKVTTPMVVGFIQHKLILPTHFQSNYSESQQNLILNHELVHLKHKDLWWNCCALLSLAVFWFHPLFWLAYKKFRQQQELACDQMVLEDKNTEQRQDYARAMLFTCVNPSYRVLTHLNYNEDIYMKERIKQMNQHHKSNKLKLLPGLVVLVLTATIGHAAFAKTYDKQKAQPTYREAPLYPIQAARDSVEGYVQLTFDIETNGSVSNVAVYKSYPEAVFDKSAVTALKTWRYKPTNSKITGAMVQLDFVLGNTSAVNAPKDKGTEIIAVKHK